MENKTKETGFVFQDSLPVVSWTKPQRWLKEYIIVFTENFMLSYKALVDIIFELPFFQLEKAIPFELEPLIIGELSYCINSYLKEITVVKHSFGYTKELNIN